MTNPFTPANATAEHEMGISSLTIGPGSTEPLGAISSTAAGGVISASSAGGLTQSAPSGVVNVASNIQSNNMTPQPDKTVTQAEGPQTSVTTEHTAEGEVTTETTIVKTTEKTVETTVPDAPEAQPVGDAVTLEVLIDFLKANSSDSDKSNTEFEHEASVLLNYFYLIPKPPTLQPGKLPGVFALVVQALLDGINGDPCEVLVHNQLGKIMRSFEDNGLNISTLPALNAVGLDYAALLRDLPQGYEPTQTS